ncbi:hypothetical protein ACFFLM_26620 [Deinococcus oregonensis]|uniref:Uncharacterized protein n=1 Tax=Deinococcus oregonensis TaxID=1805970 RepID=A0ABV6B961_9DEIO
MKLLPRVLMGAASTLSVVTLGLLFTGDVRRMTVTAVAALLLAMVAISPTVSREARQRARADNRRKSKRYAGR